MGRYIECQVGDEYHIVWKYGFGVQDSEMHRISTELGIGEYHFIRYLESKTGYEYVEEYEGYDDVDGDMLILTRQDIAKLEEQLQVLKNQSQTEEDKWYIGMIAAIRDFIQAYPQQEQFLLIAEF